MEIPVYLFVGFLESGKTTFVQGTLCDERFNAGEPTLLLVCEDGEVEYDSSKFSGNNVTIEYLSDQSELNELNLVKLRKKANAERVVIEYNGMWPMQLLFDNAPEEWVVYQCMMFADAGSFVNYNANMRGLVVDKLNCAEMIAFNRADKNADKMPLHQIVRSVSRGCDIVYEYTDGTFEFDRIEDPLPFDVDADVIDIKDDDFALFYRDLTEDLSKYDGKTVKFKGLAARDSKTPKGIFVVGRHIMTCCEEDITYYGLVCKYADNKEINSGDWVELTATLNVENHALYGGKGPVLNALSVERAEAPLKQVATFF